MKIWDFPKNCILKGLKPRFLRLSGKQPSEPATWNGKEWLLVLFSLILLSVFIALCFGKGFLGSLHLAPKWNSRWTDHYEKAEKAVLQLQAGSISKDSQQVTPHGAAFLSRVSHSLFQMMLQEGTWSCGKLCWSWKPCKQPTPSTSISHGHWDTPPESCTGNGREFSAPSCCSSWKAPCCSGNKHESPVLCE